MNANSLQAVSTEDLIAMRARVYRAMSDACVASDKRGGPRVAAADLEAAFLRYDDELEQRGVAGYSR
jgi:hypothetical protein